MEIKTIAIITIGIIGGLLATIFIAAGAFLTPTYLEPWNPHYSDKLDDPRIKVISHGLLAANSHNMQPWKVKLDENDNMSFYLYLDTDRLTPQVDPYARQSTFSQGTFLEYMNVAGSKLGYNVEINLFPEGEYNNTKESIKSKPVAKVTLKKTETFDNPLYNSIFLPDTSRVHYTDKKLANEQINQIQSLNKDNDVSIVIYQDSQNNSKLGNISVESAKIEADITRINEENSAIFRANEYQKNEYRYGFSVEGQGTSGFQMYFTEGLLTLIPSLNDEKSAKERFINHTQTTVDNTPIYAMIISKNNNRSSQVKSGMLYSRFQLTVQTMGFAVQPLSQSLEEYPEMNDVYQRIHRQYAKNGSTIQLLVRVGKPIKEVPHSMRRDVMELIMK